MQHRHAFECVDRSLRDIISVVDKRRAKKPFGSITIVFGGDFRQILPVIPKASRAEVVCATLNKSKLWDSCEVFLLKQNMRLNAGNRESENKIIGEFSKWQLAVGDGKETNISPDSDSGAMLIKIPDQYIVHTFGDPIQKLFEVTYPDFLQNISSHEYLRSRAILTPTNIVVDEINTQLLEKKSRFVFPVEYLNSINMPCILKHELKLKVGVVVMLMRNLNQIMGLCNGTRMIVKSCRKNSIECEILCGSHVGTKHLIPRIEMISSDTNWPFEFKRVQFPIQICYAMTINKSQGQSLDTVGLYLPRAAFSRGHIYVVISRVTRLEGLLILIDSDDVLFLMESFDRLSNLDKASTNWKIKVRVTRMWANMTLETNSLKGYNLILLDDNVCRVDLGRFGIKNGSNRLDFSLGMVGRKDGRFLEKQQQQQQQQAATPPAVAFKQFQAVKPPEFKGSADPVEANTWIKEMEKAFDLVGVGAEQKTKFASYFLKSEHFSRYMKNQMEIKFLNLAQGDLTFAEYEAKFTELATFVPDRSRSSTVNQLPSLTVSSPALKF
ncbi:hypothetical protein AgCh_021681 [Apium graveolens]